MSFEINETTVADILEDYEKTVKGMWEKAQEAEGRALGGYLRSAKGALVERMAEKMIRAGWNATGPNSHLKMDKSKARVPINDGYIETVSPPEVRWKIKENIDDYYYDISVDLHVHVDNQVPLAVECKSYTENAMMKRILVDFQLLTGALEERPTCVLFQLESQLGGDYSELPDVEVGSSSTRTLQSHFPEVDLEIMTLLEGERKVNRPIHDRDHYKPLREEIVRGYCQRFAEILEPFST